MTTERDARRKDLLWFLLVTILVVFGLWANRKSYLKGLEDGMAWEAGIISQCTLQKARRGDCRLPCNGVIDCLDKNRSTLDWPEK